VEESLPQALNLNRGNPVPAIASVFDSLAPDYDTWFDDEGKSVFAIEIQAFRSVSDLLPKPWLEIGVGSGRFAQALGIETGLDPSIKLLEMARKRGVDAFLGKGEVAPFQGDVFGTVFLIVTLCFVDSPSVVLLEGNRLLKEGGKLVLGLVLRESPWGRFYQVKKKEGHRFYKYATFYSFEEVRALLEQAGFAIEEVISTLSQNPGEVRGMESPLKGLSSDAGFVVIVAQRVRGGGR
jgi:SAM-dependent methyltransferase